MRSSTFSWAWAAPLLCVLLLAALAAFFSMREQRKTCRIESRPPPAPKTHNTTFYLRLRNGWLVEATVEVPQGVTVPSRTVRKLVEAATYTAPIGMSAAEMARNIFEDQGYKLVKFLVKSQEPANQENYEVRHEPYTPVEVPRSV